MNSKDIIAVFHIEPLSEKVIHKLIDVVFSPIFNSKLDDNDPQLQNTILDIYIEFYKYLIDYKSKEIPSNFEIVEARLDKMQCLEPILAISSYYEEIDTKRKQELADAKIKVITKLMIESESYFMFIKYLAVISYLINMKESSRYTADDIKTYDEVDDLKRNEVSIDAQDCLAIFYNVLNINKTEQQLESIMENNKNFHGYMFQKIYRKYFDPTHVLDVNLESKLGIVVI